MLIPSDRHRPPDLAIWEELERADAVHATTAAFFRRCQGVKDAVNAFHRRPKPYYLGVSWGKDSVVLLHFFVAMGFQPRVVYVRQLDNENPESVKVKEAFLSRFRLENYEEVSYSYRDAAPSWFVDGRPVRWYRLLEALRKKYGVHATGVRADESSTRMMRFKTHGIESRWSFAPFRHFQVEDVFAYLKLFDLPVHPNYAMMRGGLWPRDRLRVTAIGNKEGSGIGRAEWEREYFGDVLRRMESAKQSRRIG